MTMIRTHAYYGPLDMGAIYPDQNADPLDPASYHFEESDRVFQAILDGGFEPYLRLGDSLMVPGLEQRAPTNPENWVRAADEVVRRYEEAHQVRVEEKKRTTRTTASPHHASRGTIILAFIILFSILPLSLLVALRLMRHR